MGTYTILTILIGLSAAFSYFNHKYIKLPFIIGLFFISTVISLIVLSSKFWFPKPFYSFKYLLEKSNLSEFTIDIMLGFLLFAGALHTSWSHIKHQIKKITVFALGGVIASSFIVASLVYILCNAFNLKIEFIYCLLFGALISPTDPIAVIGILTKANVPKKLETIIVGESLFNDGVGVVLFVALLESLQSGNASLSLIRLIQIFFQEAVGGVLFGLFLGFLLYKLLSSIDHYETEVLLTLAFVMAGYSFCNYIHCSGALAMVVMGLFVGNFQQDKAMSDITLEYIQKFWELLDVILNAILFILIAMVLLVIDLNLTNILIASISVFIVLFSRIIVIFVPKWVFPKTIALKNAEANILVWGGLRGGLSIALVLSLPENSAKNLFLISTYFCVVFSILVQGLTIERVAKYFETSK